MAANVYGRLGDTQKAYDCATWALGTLGGEKVKTRALVLAEVACAAARAGQVDVAVESAHEAADLVEYLEVTLARRKLRALIPLLAPYRVSVGVRELFARLPLERG
jgi:hypothetical protein